VSYVNTVYDWRTTRLMTVHHRWHFSIINRQCAGNYPSQSRLELTHHKITAVGVRFGWVIWMGNCRKKNISEWPMLANPVSFRRYRERVSILCHVRSGVPGAPLGKRGWLSFEQTTQPWAPCSYSRANQSMSDNCRYNISRKTDAQLDWNRPGKDWYVHNTITPAHCSSPLAGRICRYVLNQRHSRKHATNSERVASNQGAPGAENESPNASKRWGMGSGAPSPAE